MIVHVFIGVSEYFGLDIWVYIHIHVCERSLSFACFSV